eukprot:7412529-Alexandrium_andersonii.AAC.1
MARSPPVRLAPETPPPGETSFWSVRQPPAPPWPLPCTSGRPSRPTRCSPLLCGPGVLRLRPSS